MGSSAKQQQQQPQPPPLKKKKKGRPSLLDLQKRSLRLHPPAKNPNPNPTTSNPNPNPNPYVRFPAAAAANNNSNSSPLRRSTRRNPLPVAGGDEDDDEDEEGDGSGRRRREKQLKLVLRLPAEGDDGDGDDGSHRKRKAAAAAADADRDKGGSNNKSAKATDSRQEEEASESGPATPLPDKKLLVFILDRLQKKDTYGVFSEPVDPEELPDYHDIIENPMDFGTIREKLSSGAYASLEQFEKDVFLVSSNAMRYNAPDTIYFRQARSIHELAKKNFENLRQESDDNEPEPKTVVRRGRPPNKYKKAPGRPSDRAGSDFSADATLANAVEHNQWSKGDKPGSADVSARYSHTETFNWLNEQKMERNDEYSGSSLKGFSKYGKKPMVIDENRRNTYKQPQLSTSAHELPVLATFDGDKKFLVPVGIHVEHACARSIARFAANFGPIGWAVAAKRLERMLPPGTKFGPGWVGDGESPPKPQQPLFSTSPLCPSPEPKPSPSTTTTSGNDKLPQRQEASPNDNEIEGHSSRTPQSASSPATSSKSSDIMEGSVAIRSSNIENGSMSVGGGGGNNRPKALFQLHQKQGVHPMMNGFNTAANFNKMSMMGRPMRPPGPFGSEAQMAHAQALGNYSLIHKKNMVHQAGEKSRPAENSTGSTTQPRQESVPPDLNVRFQTPGSPASGVLVHSQQQQQKQQQPDLALQL